MTVGGVTLIFGELLSRTGNKGDRWWSCVFYKLYINDLIIQFLTGFGLW